MYTLLIFVTGMFVYTYISLHTVYRRGWIRTFVKTTVFLAVFTFISLAIAAVLLIMLLSSLQRHFNTLNKICSPAVILVGLHFYSPVFTYSDGRQPIYFLKLVAK